MDSDKRCPGAIVEALIGRPETWMVFRLAVREMESWLLADAGAMARFLGVTEEALPADPDAEPDPTRTIVDLARGSRSGRIRRALVPCPGTSTSVGPLYEAELIAFAGEHWDVARAARRSRSLRRARSALKNVARRWRAHVGS